MQISTDNFQIYHQLAERKAKQYSESKCFNTETERLVAFNAFYKGFLDGLTTSIGQENKKEETDTTFGGLI